MRKVAVVLAAVSVIVATLVARHVFKDWKGPLKRATAGADRIEEVAGRPSDGLYWGGKPASEANGPEILGASVISQDNSNSLFRVEIITEQQRGWPYSPVIVAGTRTFDRWGTGKIVNPPVNSFFDENVGRADAEAIAEVLGVSCALREHPGHKLTCEFTPLSQSYKTEDEVLVRFSLRNTGDVPIHLEKGGDYRGAGRHNRFRFDITLNGARQQDVGTSSHMGGFVEGVVLKPGESDIEQLDLKKWCAFDTPGEYEVRGLFRLELRTPRELPSWPENLKWAHEQWDDEAVSTFKIRIEE